MTKPILYVQPFMIFDRRVLAYIHVKGIRDELEIVHVGPELVSPGRRPGQTPLLQVSKRRERGYQRLKRNYRVLGRYVQLVVPIFVGT